MFVISPASEAAFEAVRSFYHTLIDKMQHAKYKPGWEKGVYPADEDLRAALAAGTLYVGRIESGEIVAAMIVNGVGNDGYRGAPWTVAAEAGETSVIHALGVMPDYTGRGYAKALVQEAIALARKNHKKAVRLDVLGGNLPAQRLYTGLGFQYVSTVNMYYADTGWTDFLLYEYPL